MDHESLLARSILKWLDNSGHMFMDLDLHHRVVVASTILTERLGAVEGETCHGSMFNLDDPCPGCPLKEIFQGAEKGEAKFERQDRSGTYRRMRLMAVPVRSPRGEVLGARVLIMDITGEKAPDPVAGVLRSRYNTLAEQLPDVVFALDQTGNFTFVNAGVEQLLGYRLEDVLGTRIWNYVIPDDKPSAKSLLEVQPGSVWDTELDVVSSDGNKKHVRIRCAPTVDKENQIAGFSGVIRDRTAQRKLEEELKAYQDSLRESEQRYRNLVEEVPDIIFSLDGCGKFCFVNCQIEEFLGYSVDAMLDRYFWDYVSADCADLARSILKLRPHAIWDEELWVVDSQGSMKWVRVRCRAHTDRQGRVTEYEGVMRDRTATKKLEEDLKASKTDLMDKIKIIDDLYHHIVQAEKSKAIATHTAEVAHELRQPLAIIGGFARRMANHMESCQKLDPESQRECFRIIVGEVERLERILHGLIDFTAMEEVEEQVVNPSDLIEDVLHLNEERLREKDLGLELLFEEEITEVSVDPNRFHQVIRNLVGNAIDASPEHGVIRIETRAFIPSVKAQQTGDLGSEPYFEMKFGNSGPAIPAEDLQKIFDPFYTTKDFSMGIGLTLTKKIIEEHHGSISVKSDEGGTTFSIWLPVKYAEAPRPHASFAGE
jgi:PAS domain S-box-containing protein